MGDLMVLILYLQHDRKCGLIRVACRMQCVALVGEVELDGLCDAGDETVWEFPHIDTVGPAVVVLNVGLIACLISQLTLCQLHPV